MVLRSVGHIMDNIDNIDNIKTDSDMTRAIEKKGIYNMTTVGRPIFIFARNSCLCFPSSDQLEKIYRSKTTPFLADATLPYVKKMIAGKQIFEHSFPIIKRIILFNYEKDNPRKPYDSIKEEDHHIINEVINSMVTRCRCNY